MQGLMDVIYTLDYAEAISSLRRTNSEKAIYLIIGINTRKSS